MRKKHKLVDLYHDMSTHTYAVTIGTDMGLFTGSTTCKEEDYANESEYFGFSQAELKAEVEYARAKRNYWDAQAHALNSFWRNMAGTRNYNPNAYWVKQMRKSVDNAIAQRDMWKDRAKELNDSYHQMIIINDDFCKKLKKRGLMHD